MLQVITTSAGSADSRFRSWQKPRPAGRRRSEGRDGCARGWSQAPPCFRQEPWQSGRLALRPWFSGPPGTAAWRRTRERVAQEGHAAVQRALRGVHPLQELMAPKLLRLQGGQLATAPKGGWQQCKRRQGRSRTTAGGSSRSSAAARRQSQRQCGLTAAPSAPSMAAIAALWAAAATLGLPATTARPPGTSRRLPERSRTAGEPRCAAPAARSRTPVACRRGRAAAAFDRGGTREGRMLARQPIASLRPDDDWVATAPAGPTHAAAQKRAPPGAAASASRHLCHVNASAALHTTLIPGVQQSTPQSSACAVQQARRRARRRADPAISGPDLRSYSSSALRV